MIQIRKIDFMKRIDYWVKNKNEEYFDKKFIYYVNGYKSYDPVSSNTVKKAKY
jgi:hypothetical protein